MTTHHIGICSGPHQGTAIEVYLAPGQRLPAEQWLDGQRYVLDWGAPEDIIARGRHYCPREPS